MEESSSANFIPLTVNSLSAPNFGCDWCEKLIMTNYYADIRKYIFGH